MKRIPNNPKVRGQGVIEYAGALVMAAMIVAAAISLLPGDFTGYFGDILQAASDMLVNAVQNL